MGRGRVLGGEKTDWGGVPFEEGKQQYWGVQQETDPHMNESPKDVSKRRV